MPEQTSTAEQLNDLRQRYLAGKPWTRDELKSAINTMIGERLRAVQTAAPAKKEKAKPVSLDHLLAPAEVPAPAKEVVETKTLPKPSTSGFF